MRRFLHLWLFLGLCTSVAQAANRKQTATPAERAEDKADDDFAEARFIDAAQRYQSAIDKLRPSEQGSTFEQRLRAQQVLALYNAGLKAPARAAFLVLRSKFPDFRFDPVSVLPEVIAELDPPPQVSTPSSSPASLSSSSPIPTPASAPTFVAAATLDAPRQVTPSVPRQGWKWYYLAPLGIGQYLAGSPVRGTLFAVLESAALATNIAMAVMIQQRVQGGVTADPNGVAQLQLAMNIAAFTAIGVFVAGFVDGMFFEP